MSNFLVVGYGSIGKRHSGILRQMGHEVVTVDPALEADADYQSVIEMSYTVAYDEIEGILICTPPNVRSEVILNVNVLPILESECWFIEKPLGALTDALKSQLAEEDTQIGFNYRWCDSLERFVDVIKPQTIYSLSIVGGQHLQAWHKEDYRTLRHRYHGVVTDSLPHSLYIARWILGELSLAGSVSGKLSKLEIDVEDTAAVLLRSDTGTPCLLLADYLRQPRRFWVEAVTSGGEYHWEFSPGRDVEPMYWRQMERFVMLCEGDDTLDYPDLEDGIKVQKLLDQIKEQNEQLSR